MIERPEVERRAFLKTTAAVAAGAALPLDWRLFRGGPMIAPIGVQLYTVRQAMAQDTIGTLERVAEIGYKEVEFAGYFDVPPDALRAALDRLGMTSPAAHVSIEDLTDKWDETLEAAKIIGHEYLVVPWIAAENRRTLADYRETAEVFNGAGRRLQEAGLKFAYHNHDFEFAPMDGKIPYDVLCEAADPSLVELELDLFWIRKGGGNPVDYFKRYPGRFPMVHVKDMAPDGRQMDVGAGVIDFAGIFARRAQAGIRHFFVEHDEPADPFASITASYQAMTRL